MSLPVCKFYLSKSCKYGKNCRYLHQASQRPPPIKQQFEKQDDNDETVKRSVDFDSSQSLQLENQAKSHRYTSQDQELTLENLHIQEPTLRNDHSSRRGEKEQQKISVKTHSSAADQKVCLHFARGWCSYGKRCRFFHALPKEPRSTQRFDGHEHHSIQKKPVARSTNNVTPRFQKVDYNGTQNEPRRQVDHLNSFCDESEKRNHEANQEQSNLKSSKGSESPKKKRICQFFKSGRCTRGERCRFWHPPDVLNHVEMDFPREIKENYVKRNADKSNYITGKVLRFNEPKGNYHPGFRERKRAVQSGLKQCFTLEEIDEIGTTKLRQDEISTIQRRFPKDRIATVANNDDNFSARFKFIPTDPDWPFDVKIFEMLVSVPGNYPKEMLKISLPKDQDLPETVRRYIEITIGEWLSEKKKQLEAVGKVELVFRPFLKWLDKNIEEVTTEALKQFKRQLVAKAAGMEFFTPQQLQEKLRTNSGSTDEEEDDEGSGSGGTSDDDDSTSCTEEEDESDDEDDGLEKKSNNQSLNLDPQKKGTEIELRHLQLKENASALLFDKLKVILQCGRCKNQADMVVHQGKVISTTCAKCNQNQFVHFRPALIHQFSSTVGYLDVDGCQAFDLILQDCSVHVTCLGCSKQTKIEGLVSGQMIDGWCRACNAKFKLATEAVKFTQLVPSGVDTSVSNVIEVAPAKARKPPKDPAIKEGYPLPEFGTCKHYKHSYRWLRFPCCGKAYPCDICHDKKEDHEMTFATRMICGHCCKEQNFSASRPCNSCAQHMTKVRSAHWEGGSGCRDKISMSKGDQQKYRSMNKTTSNHKKKVKGGSSSKKNTKLRHA